MINRFLSIHKLKLIFLLTSIIILMITLQSDNIRTTSIALLGSSTITALLWLFLNLKISTKTAQNSVKPQRRHFVWVVVLLAVLLRLYALTIFPVDTQTGFEEIQTGANALQLMTIKEIPIEFRFTNLTGALGFILTGTHTLFSLRLGFRVLGFVSLILLAGCLHSEKTNWVVTSVILFFAATAKFLVLSGAVADEIFAGTSFLLGFLFSLYRLQVSKNQIFWSGCAGIFAGMLFMEYISYRIPVLILVLWLVFFYQRKVSWKERLPILFSFGLCWFLFATPTIIQSIRQPESSYFFDGLNRHFQERTSFFPTNSLFNLKNTFLAVFGYSANIGFFYTPDHTPMIQPFFGKLFFISLWFNLFFARHSFQKFLSISVLVSLISISIFSNNINMGRAFPSLILLVLITANFLNFVISQFKILLSKLTKKNWFPQRFKKINPVWKNLSQVIATWLLLAVIVITNLSDLYIMAHDPSVLGEFVNDEFALCSFLGEVSQPSQKVYFFNINGNLECPNSPPASWYFSDHLINLVGLPLAEFDNTQFNPGDLIIMGNMNTKLESLDYEKLVQLGLESDSLDSIQSQTDLTGKTIAASMCYQCK